MLLLLHLLQRLAPLCALGSCAAALGAACPALAGRLTAQATPAAGLAWLIAAADADGNGAGVGAGTLPVVAGSLHLLGEVIPLLDPAPAPGEGR